MFIKNDSEFLKNNYNKRQFCLQCRIYVKLSGICHARHLEENPESTQDRITFRAAHAWIKECK